MSMLAFSFAALLGAAAAAPIQTGCPDWACSLKDAPKQVSSFDASLPPWGTQNKSVNFHLLAKGSLHNAKGERVEAVDAENLTAYINEGRALLVVFYAPWCPHCHDFVIKGNTHAPIEMLNKELIRRKGPKVVKFNIQQSPPPSQFPMEFIPTTYAVTASGAAVKYSGDPGNLEKLENFAVAQQSANATVSVLTNATGMTSLTNATKRPHLKGTSFLTRSSE
jgi:thiol-disulfide isomerase/thioredoxin